MKRLSLFCAALFAAVVTFAGTIVYDLQGGVTNDFGWKNKQDMYATLNADWNAFSGASTTWTSLEQLVVENGTAEAAVPKGIPTQAAAMALDFLQDANFKLHFQWLVDYMDAECTAQGKTVASSNASFLRYNLSAFFLSSVRPGWPASPDYSIAGEVEAFQATWKHGFDNPTTLEEGEWVLNAPYKEGESFRGWYDNASGSGEKVTSINAEFNGTLYACFGEYINTIKEANEAQGDSVLTAGTVVFVRGTRNVYIQDATAGTLLYLKQGETVPAVGDYVIVWGESTTYNGAQEISGAVIRSTSAGTLPTAQAITLATFLAAPLDYFAERVSFEGLKITAHDNNGMYVTDGVDTVQCFNMKPDQTVFPVGSRVNLNCIGSYFNKPQLVGDAASVVAAPLAGRDTYEYAARGENGEYTITNKWLFSNKLENYSANRPANTNSCRGMAAYNGKMYFIDRENACLKVVDGATGEMLDPLPITGEHLFQKYDEEKNEWVNDVTLPFNDVKFDNAGHCLITACSSNSQGVYVYKVDLTTGAATELIKEHLYDNPDFYDPDDEKAQDSWRVDAIGVYGDVTGKAVVMFGNSMNADLNVAYKWDINNGVVAPAEKIELIINPEDDSYMIDAEGKIATENLSACQVFPVDFNYFYWDHHSCRPTLFAMDGTFVDDLKACPTATTVWNTPNDSLFVGAGHNGICEFQIGPDYFVIMAATNNEQTPPCAFALFKFADQAKSFDGLTPLWYLPADGMGKAQNAYRTAVPTVEVDGNKATIYLYVGENGYGVYEMTGVEGPKVIEKLYVTGNIEGSSWDPAAPIEMTPKGDQVFEKELTFTDATSYFALSTATGDWDAFNAERFGANPNNALVAVGAPVDLVATPGDGTACITVAAGTYKVTADMVAMKLSIEVTDGVEDILDDAVSTKRIENGNLIIIRNGVRYNAIGATMK